MSFPLTMAAERIATQFMRTGNGGMSQFNDFSRVLQLEPSVELDNALDNPFAPDGVCPVGRDGARST
jgi:hypothetical protein